MRRFVLNVAVQPMTTTQYGTPFICANFTETSARSLKRMRFEKGRDADFNERWLQKLVSRYPNVLPIEEIEPALTPLIPICMELPLGQVSSIFYTLRPTAT